MSLQYITNSKGQTTGVFIPINEWNKLKKKFNFIEKEDIDIPEWHVNEVNERLQVYKNNPEDTLDFNSTLDEIESEL